MQWWIDITCDPKTRHYVAKDLFKAVAFFLGCALAVASAASDAFGGIRPISPEPALFLLAFALGAQSLKQYSTYQNRRTADENGNALAQPGTAEPPADPVLMPQAPAAPDARQ